MQEVLGDKVKEVHVSKRLEDSPAIIVNADGHMTSSMERVMRAARHDENLAGFSGKNLEINPDHGLIASLDKIREEDTDFAAKVVGQIFDNAMIQAGLMVDPRSMVERSYRILERAVKS